MNHEGFVIFQVGAVRHAVRHAARRAGGLRERERESDGPARGAVGTAIDVLTRAVNPRRYPDERTDGIAVGDPASCHDSHRGSGHKADHRPAGGAGLDLHSHHSAGGRADL